MVTWDVNGVAHALSGRLGSGTVVTEDVGRDGGKLGDVVYEDRIGVGGANHSAVP